MNPTGLITAISTFLSIWFGHVAVRKIEYSSPTLWLPSLGAALLGLGCEWLALTSAGRLPSAVLGIFGITLLFDALEFYRQDRRVQHGHAPANPNNPRHAAYLLSGTATTVALLKHEPDGGVR
jgi:hypothetical protein